jgi:predicted Fe-Mo cluster-binding NifX family protein
MKVAIAIFRNGVSPRVDISDSLLIYDLENSSIKNRETCSLSFEQPSELVSFLQKKDIRKIICGGCPQFYLRTLNFYGFDVIHGLSGNPGHIVKSLIDGKLDGLPVNGACRRNRRGRDVWHRNKREKKFNGG